jgi:hypothetical protein
VQFRDSFRSGITTGLREQRGLTRIEPMERMKSMDTRVQEELVTRRIAT